MRARSHRCTPAILKTRRLGYDGKGQFRIRTRADADAAWGALGAQAEHVGLILEGFVSFERELSVVAVRGRDGEFRAWPITENWHEAGVLSASLAPARVDPALAQRALDCARRVAGDLDYVGVFALELFVCGETLLANEMAPRVHNSGHWTIEGAETSQFQNHLRAVLGLPLGSTACAWRVLHAELDRHDAGECRGAERCRWSLARLWQVASRGSQGGTCDFACRCAGGAR
jgi:5-(carboxyamino)imidazole ribonucleotide synthase